MSKLLSTERDRMSTLISLVNQILVHKTTGDSHVVVCSHQGGRSVSVFGCGQYDLEGLQALFTRLDGTPIGDVT